ncbi:hypothetical protein HGRIS_003594 [Hohenbuehelia grisea]|uniref:dolichol kinase n=1 Tax=Hohenbuehelia grisea TaxID=104357 RepID=A0ABR3JHI1_9AGAR
MVEGSSQTSHPLDWSTSYQAGSSSATRETSDDEDSSTEDEDPHHSRGRRFTVTRSHQQASDDSLTSLRATPRPVSELSTARGSSLNRPRVPFTRSRSPAVRSTAAVQGISKSSTRSASPRTTLSRLTRSTPGTSVTAILPGYFRLTVTTFGVSWECGIDARKAVECLILLSSTLFAIYKIASYQLETLGDPHLSNNINLSTSLELCLLCVVSFLYIIWSHSSMSWHDDASKIMPGSPATVRPQSPSSKSTWSSDARDTKRQTMSSTLGRKSDFNFIWMSVPKNYRESSDDGILTALLLGPLIAAALLYSSLQRRNSLAGRDNPLPYGWLIEPPPQLPNQGSPISALESLILSRYNLVDLATFCSTILLVHICASWWSEARHSKSLNAPDGERASVPRSEGLRLWYYVLFAFGVSSGFLGVKVIFKSSGIDVWQHMTYFEIAMCSLFYQFTLYAALRLAHRGFTLGELGLVCFGGISIFMELLNLTIARIWPITTSFIKTYRLPTPLLVFQLALIAGSFLTGFLLSPFLVLSRHIAQRPVRRLRNPEEKQRQRRYLALGFYVGSVLLVGGLIGMWTRWCLGKRDPWLWVLFRLFEGRRPWSRPLLLAYWALLGSLSVAGWNRQLARSRRYRSRNTGGENTTTPEASGSAPAQAPDGGSPAQASAASAGPLSLTFPALPNLPNLPNGANVASDLLDAADKHVPTLGLNARRKFFHALAVVMFAPGIAFDPAFTHLSFSVAFALFTFAEYVRYFAVYPFGAAIHVFMNDFLDHKDSGTAILSHFYLLTGCAGSVWLEGSVHVQPLSVYIRS